MRVLSVYSTTAVGRKKVAPKVYVIREIVGYEIPDATSSKARLVAAWYLSNGKFMEVGEHELISASSATAYAMLALISSDMWLANAQLDKQFHR
jgi:hypothetical protein